MSPALIQLLILEFIPRTPAGHSNEWSVRDVAVVENVLSYSYCWVVD